MTDPTGRPTIVVVGAGPGIGGSVARAFGARGYDVGLVGRGHDALTMLGESLQGEGLTAGWTEADVTDPVGLTAAIERLASHSGRVDVLHFNPSAYRPKDPLALTVPELLEDLALGVGGLLTSVRAARPYMSAGARVTATGSAAADRPAPGASSLGVQKAGLRNLVRSLDATLAPDGIRAVSVTVNGVLAPNDPGSPFHPDRVAQAILAAASQDETGWRSEVAHPESGPGA
jgi:NAD(P)-dependent dehydrogenase (short-subunit alcohol dehydrogenase family)